MKKDFFKTIGLFVFVSFVIAGCAAVEKTQYTIGVAKGPVLPPSLPDEYIAPYENHREQIEKDIRGEDAARKKALRIAYEKKKTQAFLEAAEDISKAISVQIQPDKLRQMAIKAAKDPNDSYLKESKILKQEVEKAANVMVLSLYYKIDKKKLKDAILASVETTELDYGDKEILPLTVPASTSDIYVASFSNIRMQVPEDVANREEARKETIQKAIEYLKSKAFIEAAEEVYHDLAQPINKAEFKRAVKKANKNYPNFIVDFKITKQVVETKGPLAVQPEKVKISAYFRIDKRELRKMLVGERGISTPAKYKTYVELFWNVEGKDIHPEVIDSVIKTMEDYFVQKNYEIVQFEGIMGKLVLLMKEKNMQTDDLYSQNELERFKAKLLLRNIDKKFVRGKQILADYADILIGVTIKAVGKVGNMVVVRLSAEATLFERGVWVSLAYSEKNAAIPYIPGRPDTLTAVCRKGAIMLAEDLEPKILSVIGKRSAIERVKTGEERDFVLIFTNMARENFAKIKSLLMRSNKWVFKGADFPKRSINLSYRGLIDDLAEKIELFLEGAGIKPGVAEYTGTANRILFGGR